MKIVNKYALAMCPYGTPFYVLEDAKAYRYDSELKKDIPLEPKVFNILDGIKILTSKTFYNLRDNIPMFNGVNDLLPDTWSEEDKQDLFITEDNIDKLKFETYEIDTDSNDYNDDDRFLVLDSKEFKTLLDQLNEYYNQLCIYENSGKEVK